MIDKIKAEANAIPCGKDEKIKALEALLKLALDERDEALAYGERLRSALNMQEAISGGVESGDSVCKLSLAALTEQPPAALEALKAEWQAEVVESFLLGLNSLDTINIHNKRPDARVEWFRKRAKEEGDE